LRTLRFRPAGSRPHRKRTVAIVAATLSAPLTLLAAHAGEAASTTVTLGPQSTVNATASQAGAGFRFGSELVPARSGVISRFSLYVSGGEQAQVLTPVVYATAAGQPTTLLSTGRPVTVPAHQAARWVSSQISATVAGGRPVLLGLLSGGASRGAYEYSQALPGAGIWALNRAGSHSADSSFSGATHSNDEWLFNMTETPAAPAKPTVPVKHTAPARPTVPVKHTAPARPTVPAKHSAPARPTVPAKHSAPARPTVPPAPTSPRSTVGTPLATTSPAPTSPGSSNCAQSAVPATSSPIPGYTFDNAQDFRHLPTLPAGWGTYEGPDAQSYFSASHVGVMNDGVHGQALYIKGYPDGHGLPITTGGLQDNFNATSGGFSTCLDFDTVNTTGGGAGVKIVVMSWPSDNQWPQHGEIDALEGNVGHWDSAVVIGRGSQYPSSNADYAHGYYNLSNGSAWAPIVYPTFDSSTPHEVTVLWDPINGINIYYGTSLVNHVPPSEAPGGWYSSAYGSTGRNIAIQTEYLGGALANTKADARIYWVSRFKHAG